MKKSITTQILTFEDACKAKGLDPEKVLPDVSAYPAEHQKALTATAKLIIVADALNGGWKPDWNDYDEQKFLPWFDMEKTKSNPCGFSLRTVYWLHVNSGVGSRLCFRTREAAQHAATQFADLYRDLMII